MEFFLGFKKNEIFIINEMVKLNFYYLKKGKIWVNDKIKNLLPETTPYLKKIIKNLKKWY